MSVGCVMMERLRRLIGWLTLSSREDGLIVAQYNELHRQIPLLYAVLSVNAVAVSFTHWNSAPVWMTVWVPLVLVSVSLFRLGAWIVRPRQVADQREALKRLRRTTALSVVIALAYISWSLALYEYGGAEERAHVALFIATTVIGCIFCLMHLPQAALAVTVVVMTPYLAFQLGRGGAVHAAIAFNILLVNLLLIRVLMNSFGSFRKLIAMQTESARLNREVTHLANTDMLTGLPNRRMFFGEVDRKLERCRETGASLTLGALDLDRFKAANDAFGHVLGDQLLKAVAERLSDVFEDRALLARLGGDEFAFLIEADAETANELAGVACREIARPFHLGDTSIVIGATCGIAERQAGVDANALYDCADYALYFAKHQSRGASMIYSAEHEHRIRAERAIEVALQNADLKTEFRVHFQPIVDVRSGRVVAAETLARWTNAELGTIAPDIFIPLAERAGLIHALSLALLDKALDALEMLPEHMMLSFNLSAHDLNSRETVDAITSRIEGCAAEPGRLIIELTETAVLRDFGKAEQAIGKLRALGVQIALDDFGTGQSSLSYLHRLPIDHVKIDRAFITGTEGESGRELLAAVIGLCKTLRMKCVAEGVEQVEQLEMLRVIGCDEYQGYLFSKPMPLQDFQALLSRDGGATRYASSA